MFSEIENLLPQQWRMVFRIMVSPIVWLLSLQQGLISFFLESDSAGIAFLKFIFLLLPILLFVAALWCTQLSIYTVPFRSGRIHFFSMMLLSWWDTARAVWLYWTGIVRFLLVALGWLFSIGRLFLKLMVEAVRHILAFPFTVTGKMTKSYFKPGVPWIAFLMLLFWCLLEAVIFTYTLLPTVTEVLSDLVGVESSRSYVGPILYLFLFMLIMGSFACIQAFIEAVRKGEFKYILQVVLVELFVMFFEVIFLYRELVDAITPWIAQQTGERFRMGIGFTLLIATFGWVGIRGMTWFLFGRFGTPPLQAFISRRPLVEEGVVPETLQVEAVSWWKKPIEDLKGEIGWLHEKGNEFVEYLALPALQIFAAVLNFSLVLVASRTVFSLPFKNLKEVMDTREILVAMQIQAKPMEPKKVAS
ncbi:MAG: hypothetical protein ACHQYP_10075 [Nitrospiria bacterium]